MTLFGLDNCPGATRAQLARLTAGLRAACGDTLRSVVLHGSLALGSFSLQRSDIDVLALVDGEISDVVRAALTRALLDGSMQPHPIELSLLDARVIAPWTHPAPYEFHYSESWRARAQAAPPSGGTDPDLSAHVFLALARGRALFGPAPADALPEVPEALYRAAILDDVLSDQFGLPGLLQSTTPVYVALNACRTLAYLLDGKLRSKDEGGMWALIELPWWYSSFVAKALEALRAGLPDPEYSIEDRTRFMNYLISRVRAATIVESR